MANPRVEVATNRDITEEMLILAADVPDRLERFKEYHQQIEGHRIDAMESLRKMGTATRAFDSYIDDCAAELADRLAELRKLAHRGGYEFSTVPAFRIVVGDPRETA